MHPKKSVQHKTPPIFEWLDGKRYSPEGLRAKERLQASKNEHEFRMLIAKPLSECLPLVICWVAAASVGVDMSGITTATIAGILVLLSFRKKNNVSVTSEKPSSIRNQCSLS